MSAVLSSADAVMYVLLFVVPGFVWYSVVSVLTPRKTESSEVVMSRLMWKLMGIFRLPCEG